MPLRGIAVYAPGVHLNPVFSIAPGALVYELLTSQDGWRREIASLLRHAGGEALARRDGVRLLDLGCGPGESTFALARAFTGEAEVVGIDLYRAMVARARRRHRRRHRDLTGVRFEVADATHLPFAERSFDLAIGHSFLYLVRDRAAVLREARRVLRPGGQLLLMEPHADGSLRAAARRGLRDRQAGWIVRRPLTGARFLASMALWRLVSGASGRLTADQVRVLFTTAGFENIEVHPTLGGLGLECVGRIGVA